MTRRSPTPPTTRWGAVAGSRLRQHRSGYLLNRAERLMQRPDTGAMTVDALQDIVTRLSDEWGLDCPPITVDDTVNGQIGRVTQLRGHTRVAFEPAVLHLPVADAEVAVGPELGVGVDRQVCERVARGERGLPGGGGRVPGSC
jgi:hypothetical protein